MIVGNGLIAKAFKFYSSHDNVIIFASGVSNSSEKKKEQFEREFRHINEYICLEKKFIYFSTISVIDGSESTPYIEHKKNLENFISKNHENYLIFRLPIVVGSNANDVTFFNSIKNKIIRNEIVKIYDVKRYLIDIDDLSSILPVFIDDVNEKNKVINVCFENFSSVSDIVNKMEKFLNKSCKKEFKNSLSNHEVDNSYFKNRVKYFDYNYNENLIKKYLS